MLNVELKKKTLTKLLRTSLEHFLETPKALLHAVLYAKNLIRFKQQFTQLVETKNLNTTPVILIQGFLGTANTMLPIHRRLSEDGIRSFFVELGAINIQDIKHSAETVRKYIERLALNRRENKVDIVAHSMGGLIALYYILYMNGHEKVRRLVLLGTPVHGTWSALTLLGTFGFFCRSIWQLLPRSSLVKKIVMSSIPKQVEVFTIAAKRDRICPAHRTRVEGARDMEISGGHSSLVISQEAYHLIKAILIKRSNLEGDISNESARIL